MFFFFKPFLFPLWQATEAGSEGGERLCWAVFIWCSVSVTAAAGDGGGSGSGSHSRKSGCARKNRQGPLHRNLVVLVQRVKVRRGHRHTNLLDYSFVISMCGVVCYELVHGEKFLLLFVRCLNIYLLLQSVDRRFQILLLSCLKQTETGWDDSLRRKTMRFQPKRTYTPCLVRTPLRVIP